MMLNYLFPHWHGVISHPIYRLEAGQINPRRRFDRLWRHSLMWFLRMLVLVFILWGILQLEAHSRPDVFAPYSMSLGFLAWGLLLGVVLNLLVDFFSITASFNGILKERMSTHWSLISLTLLDEQAVIRTKHALAQLKAWRVTMIVMGLRLALIFIFFVQVCFVPQPTETVLQSMVRSWQDGYDRTGLVMLILILAVVLPVYALEPLWRMRTLTAIGTALSARMHSSTMALLAGFAAALGVWVGLSVIVGGFWFALVHLTLWMTYQVYSRNVSMSDVFMFVFFLAVCAMGVIIFFYYRLLGRWCLRRAQAAAFRLD